jgi:RND family efflux transporter MFP subunit
MDHQNSRVPEAVKMAQLFFSDRIKIGWYIFGILLILLFFSCAASWAQDEKPGGEASLVVVEKVIQRNVRPTVALIGTTIPNKESTVAAEVGGLVVSFPVRSGQQVKDRDILVKIETRPQLLQLKSARARLAEAKENLANAESELKRNEALFKQKSISSREYEKALYSYNAINEKIMGLKAEIELIQYRLSKSVIRAPFSGFVVEEHTQVGQWLKEGEKAITLAEIDPILVTVPVPDRYIHHIKLKQKVSLEFDFLARNKVRTGYVRDIIPKGNEKARTFPVQVRVSNSDFSLYPGMSCKVNFSAGASQKALLVNKDAVITGAEGHNIFVVRDGKAAFIPVSQGQAYDNLVSVEGDLSPDELVVVEGNERLRPGEAVRAVERENK